MTRHGDVQQSAGRGRRLQKHHRATWQGKKQGVGCEMATDWYAEMLHKLKSDACEIVILK